MGSKSSDQTKLEGHFDRELAHKLGNLLQVVNGNLELLSSRLEDPKLRGYVVNAQSAAQELTEITRHLNSNGRD